MHKKEKIIKTRAGWKKEEQIKKIKIIMTFVVVALCLSIASGTVLAWIEIKHPFQNRSSSQSSKTLPASSKSDELPVYDNDFNLVIVNSNTALSEDFSIQLEKYNGYLFDQRILPALKKMINDAADDGRKLKICGGYVDKEEQDALFKKEVQLLMQTQGYTQVRAENKVQSMIGRGGYNENQTGMAVTFCSDTNKTDFSKTEEYKWLVKNSINYGFVLRYPENKINVTGTSFNPSHFRYVGIENATRMREYSMCLEDYAQYVRMQSRN